MVIAIDGPAGVGKSTIASLISQKLGFYYLNSGNFYRAATLRAIENNIDLSDKSSCIKCTDDAIFDIIDGKFFLDGKNVDDKLHTSDIDLKSSYFSSIEEVRLIINKRIHDLTSKLDIVAEGRDMTSVVFPDADYKFYFDAEVTTRAQRRYKQNINGLTYDKILSEINERDENDKNKSFGALKLEEGAIYIDTTHLTIEQVCKKVLKCLNINK